MFTDDRLGLVDDLNSFSVALEAYQGLALLLLPPPAHELEPRHLSVS